MEIKQLVLNTIKKHKMITRGEKIVTSVSGGPDSMALLYLLYDLRDELECTLHVAHLDHQLRGEESKADADYVKDHAQRLGLDITLESINVAKLITPKESIESGARRIRYDFYTRVMNEVKADKIALGHNSDDQAETVIMRLLRGSGTKGLMGIPAVREDKFIRPIIEIDRKQINQYLKNIGITACQDSTNLSTYYLRNKIRLELIPLLEKYYSPNIKQILQQTADILRAEDDFLNQLIRNIWAECIEKLDAHMVEINDEDFKRKHIAVQRRLIRLAVEFMIGHLMGFDYKHVETLRNLILGGETGSRISLPHGIVARKTYGKLIIQKDYLLEDEKEYFHHKIHVPGNTYIPELSMTIEININHLDSSLKYQESGRFNGAFDYSKITGYLQIRNRKPGDRFQPLGMNNMKKLKDFFIDEKIPVDIRDKIPLLTDEKDRIIWVVGYRIDDRFKLTPETKEYMSVDVVYDSC
ncbi:tRNA lysidine(34) synthetase TilS [Candidatus Poribacteria bacterium]|nr:tRNA lysidine(34) synthetase TilS [Candidatus Poribacteria bacterium]